MHWERALDTVLLVALLISVVTDIKSRIIYNKVVFPGLIAAFLLHVGFGGVAGLFHAFAGFAVGFALLLIPYLIGGMGAGDVKLLALVGACKGYVFVLTASVYMAVIGAVMALAALLIRRGSMDRIRWTAYYLAGIRHGIVLPIGLYGELASVGYPYGVAIAGGAICAMLF